MQVRSQIAQQRRAQRKDAGFLNGFMAIIAAPQRKLPSQ
jgi:hypothetical protein